MDSPLPKVLALDLVGTLVSDTPSHVARPGLFEFLTECYELFERVVVLGALNEPQFRELAACLVRDRRAPIWFTDVEYIQVAGSRNNLSRVLGTELHEMLLVDDSETVAEPSQRDRWIPIECFADPALSDDKELERVSNVLVERASVPVTNALWEELIAKGTAMKQNLLNESGGTLSACEVAELLGVSEAMVDQQRRDSKVLAVQIDGEWRYPRCQFEGGTVSTVLAEVQPLIAAESPWIALAFLVTSSEGLDGLSPLEALRTKDPALCARARRMARLLEGDGYG